MFRYSVLYRAIISDLLCPQYCFLVGNVSADRSAVEVSLAQTRIEFRAFGELPLLKSLNIFNLALGPPTFWISAKNQTLAVVIGCNALL